MTPERYQQIGHLFDEALERPAAERAAFLKEASGDDAALCAEVENLLANHVASESFLARPAMEVAAALLSPNPPTSPVLVGQQISHYQILSLLGEGGMGQVYLAKDTQLGRQVALKLLPTRFLQSAEHLRRFEREALAASALNHPNILTIYEFGKDGETYFLATEYVEGENLRQRSARGQLTVVDVLDLTVQIVAALHAAHAAHIIHRDIKPDNVMVRHDGIVKVLDFGLAKLVEQVQQDNALPLQKQQVSLTQRGAIIGTVAYMSPEQARGQAVDACTDLFSVGVMLYELLTGRQPFTGETVSHTIVAILEKDPPPITEQSIPAELEQILQRLLAKNVAARYPDAQTLLTDLKRLSKRLEREEGWPLITPAIHRAEAATQIIQLQTHQQLGDVTMQVSPNDSALHAVDLAHVLCCDIVGYSLLPLDRQTHALQTLQKLVQQTEDYKRADARGQLVRWPAGDGMALAFLQDVAAPVRCAVDLTRALQAHSEIRVRIGIHSGPVSQSADINANGNVVGTGINLAQRVMDCGDAGHILMSRNIAEVLEQVSHWQPLLHDLGEHEGNHGVRLHLFNLYNDEIGNAVMPQRLQANAPRELATTATTSPSTLAPRAVALEADAAVIRPSARRKAIWLLVAIVATSLVSIPIWQAWRSRTSSSSAPTVAASERNLSYFLTVQRYRNSKPYQTEFQSSGREIFEAGWQFKLNVTSPQDGFLYLLNEEANGAYVLLFPLPSHNNGAARLAAHERLQTGWYLFDEKPGTEQFRLIWAAHPIPELEALRALVNPTDKGRVNDSAQIQTVRALLHQHANSPLESTRDAQNKQTTVRGTGAVLVALIELEHQ